MRVKSKIDGWTAIMLWLLIGLSVWSIFFLPPVGVAVVLVVAAFLLSLFFFTYYELRDSYLYCRSGPFVEKIPYASISRIRLCTNLLASMALSYKRIEIKRSDRFFIFGTTYISPKNREAVYNELIKRRDDLEKKPSSARAR